MINEVQVSTLQQFGKTVPKSWLTVLAASYTPHTCFFLVTFQTITEEEDGEDNEAEESERVQVQTFPGEKNIVKHWLTYNNTTQQEH